MPLKTPLPKHDSEYQGLIASAVASYIVPRAEPEPELILRMPDEMAHELALPQFKPSRWLRKGKSQHSFSTAAPHPIYQLGREDLAKGRGLDAAVQVGWRYLIYSDDRCVAAGYADSQDGQHSAVLNRGPFVESTRAAIELAESLPQVKSAVYEPALLAVPALYVLALWLRSPNAAAPAILIPLSPKPAQLTQRTYAAEELVPLLTAMAQQQIDEEASGGGLR